MIKIIFLITLLYSALCFAQEVTGEFPGLAKQEYVEGMEDVPLYHGFIPEDDNISYDVAGGRIVDASFSSVTASADDVRKFYDVTLPELGWKQSEYQVYKRDNEILKLNILQKEVGTILKFSVRPVL